MKKTISPIRTICKVILILFLLTLISGLLPSIIRSITDGFSYDDEAYRWKYMNQLTADEKYGELYDDLTLYKLYEEKYEDLWTVTEAYHHYCRYRSASNAAHLTADTDFERLCEEQAEEAYQALWNMPTDQENATARAAILRIKAALP